MAATELTGINIALYAFVSAAQALVAGARSADLTIDGESIDASHAGSSIFRQKLVGMIGWGISSDGVVMLDVATGEIDPAQDALLTAILAKLPIAIELRMLNTVFAGTIIVNNFSLAGTYDDVATYSISGEGAGALVHTPTI